MLLMLLLLMLLLFVILQITSTPMWSWENEHKWMHVVLQPDVEAEAHRVNATELSKVDFSKFGIEPKVI